MRFVVVDTNCLLRMIPMRSKYRLAWESFLDGKYILCVSNEIVSEYMEILTAKVSPSFAENIVGAILRSPFVRRFWKKRSISTHPKRGYPFTFSDSLILMALQK